MMKNDEKCMNMAVPLNGLRVDRGMYLQFSLARC